MSRSRHVVGWLRTLWKETTVASFNVLQSLSSAVTAKNNDKAGVTGLRTEFRPLDF
jgi:hypothetical protein